MFSRTKGAQVNIPRLPIKITTSYWFEEVFCVRPGLLSKKCSTDMTLAETTPHSQAQESFGSSM